MSSYKILKEDGDYLLLETGDFLLQDPPILIDVYDSITTNETVFLNNAYELDEIQITENISISMDAGDISMIDSISVIDDVNILHDIWYFNPSDAIAISEDLFFDWPLIIRATETIRPKDNVSTQSIQYSSDNRRPRWPHGGIAGGINKIE